MGFFPPGYQHRSCELCKFCGGWLIKRYAQAPGVCEIMLCTKPGHPPSNPQPEFGCAYWVEAPEIALGFYD